MRDIYPKRYIEFLRLVHVTDPECQRYPDVFFPEEWEGKQAEATKIAKEICERCPIKIECLAYAIKANEQEGIWGGQTPYGRRSKREK